MKSHLKKSDIAVINYGSQVIWLSSLTSDRSILYDALKKISKIGGQRRIDIALTNFEDEVFGSSNQNNRTKQVILFVTGKNSLSGKETLSVTTQRLKDKGVKFTVIGIGNNVDVGEAEDNIIW